MKVKVAQLYPTLCDPRDYTVHGILWARILWWVAFPFSRGSSQPRDPTHISLIAGGFFTSWATREAPEVRLYLLLIQIQVAVLVQSCIHVWLFPTPWITACQASLSLIVQSLPKFMSIASVMPSNHLILCYPLLLPSVFPSIRVFSNESALGIRWPKYWSFIFSISLSNECSGLISF